MNKLDVFSGVFWLIVSAYICINSTRLGLGRFHNPGPGFLFFWGGIVLGILSIIVLIMALVSKRKGIQEGEERIFGNINWVKVIAVVLSLIAYGIILERLGFLVSTFLFIAFLLSSIEPKKWYIVIITAIVSSSLTYALFEIWLKVRLPKGILGI